MFRETQRMRQWWLIVLMLAVTLFTVFGIWTSRNEEKWWNLLVPITILMLTNVLIFSMTLRTWIDTEGVAFSYMPLLRKRIFEWKDIEKAEIIQYSMWEAGGYGIRLGAHGWTYNTSGNMGLKLKLKSGKTLLIGTQKAEELKEILEKIHR